jgi:AcrR family transcriptional regulator
MRADAVKNRRRILEAAEEVFAAQGIAVPVDEVAEKAGVGVGTLYRHFPTKEALFEAIVQTRLEELASAAREAADAAEPGEALFGFLQRFAETAAMKHDLIDALASAGIDLKSRCADSVALLEQQVGRLLQKGADSGSVRDDVTAKQVMSLIMGACMASGNVEIPGSREQLVTVVCDGLRAPASALQRAKR